MKLLYDAVLPPSLSVEARGTLDLRRWDGADAADTELVRSAAGSGYRAVIFLDRSSLDQPGLRTTAEEVGVALVAVDADDPIEAKQRILRNAPSLRRKLADYDCLLILAGEVRPLDEPD
ncbi:MAG: hypothetical protein OXG55_09380 [bacterium]|nr:hypothetical protein [bacterium]MCY3924844.1 hypothetical protein [bacterium]MCY3924846.1 hypothetical protein [bacterium]MCY3953253.1 hypothetical protein [bacterium]MCY4103456.1 hypothetical protein [bacterium]